MSRIKEKAPVTPASATSANSQHKVDQTHIEDTTDWDKMQGRYCASNYLEYGSAPACHNDRPFGIYGVRG